MVASPPPTPARDLALPSINILCCKPTHVVSDLSNSIVKSRGKSCRMLRFYLVLYHFSKRFFVPSWRTLPESSNKDIAFDMEDASLHLACMLNVSSCRQAFSSTYANHHTARGTPSTPSNSATPHLTGACHPPYHAVVISLGPPGP